MKILSSALVAASLLSSASAFADASKVPSFLKGAVIEVMLKNGEKHKFSSDEYAVVKRSSSNSVKVKEVEKKVLVPGPERIVEKVVEKTIIIEKEIEIAGKCKKILPVRELPKGHPTLEEMASNAEVAAQKHRLRLQVGAGPNGVKAKESEGATKVEQNYTPVTSLGYDFKVSKKLSVGGQVMTNRALTLGLGLDL